MNLNKNRIACKADIGLCDQKKESGGEGIRRLGSMLRVLVPAVLISIALIACPDSADTTSADTTAPVVSAAAVTAGTGIVPEESVTITATVSEIGNLFWVVYADDTPPPANAAALVTAAGIDPSGTTIANSGSDGHLVSKVGVQTISISNLIANTPYDIYIVAKDAAGNNSALSDKLEYMTPTGGDTTVPILSAVSAGTATATSVPVSATVNEMGMLFWVAYADGTAAPSNAAALVTDAGKDPSTTATIIASSTGAGQGVPMTGVQMIDISGLTASTTYDVYIVAKDAAGNNSALSTKLEITTTADTTAPILSAVSESTKIVSTTTTFAVDVTTNEIGKLFWVAYKNDTTAPNVAALITAAGADLGDPIFANSTSTGQTVSTTGTQTIAIAGLTANTLYDVYIVAQDAAGNNSTLSPKVNIVTMTL